MLTSSEGEPLGELHFGIEDEGGNIDATVQQFLLSLQTNTAHSVYDSNVVPHVFEATNVYPIQVYPGLTPLVPPLPFLLATSS